MSPYFPFRLPRAAHGWAGMLCLMLLACSGGKDATGPNPGPLDPPPANDPPAGDPGPPQPAPSIAGAYVLARINNSEPGQMVTLANPDGSVIGLYRFHENTVLGLAADQTWTLSLHFEDEHDADDLEDEGRFTRQGADGEELTFQSATFGDVFPGRAQDGVAAIHYDLDGDGQTDTVFGFTRLLGGGTGGQPAEANTSS